jgi:leucyl aminopeptidase
MRIVKSTQLKETPGRIILVRSHKDLEKLLAPARVKLVEDRFQKDRKNARIQDNDRILFVVKLGDEHPSKSQQLEEARKAAQELHGFIDDLDWPFLQVENLTGNTEEGLAFAEGMALTAYQFLKYKTGKNNKPRILEEVRLIDPGLTDDLALKLQNLVQAVYLTRNLVNEPLSFLTAEQLAREFESMGQEAGFQVEVFTKKKIQSLKMGGLLAVNRGSVDPPTFSILSWQPDNAINKRPLVLVGKGVVYDTGGLSLKPTQDSMDYMKCDMAGAAAVGGALYAAAKNDLPLWIIGLVPATDNRPDGNAYVPGDVVTMYDGTTVEVLNTDAEGRMILADALSYAKQYDPEVVIELSTLTGSAHAAIDKYGIVGMGNAGLEIMEILKESGETTCERIAEFPFWDEYKEQLKSEIADLKNIGGRYGGAITAGKFLEHFTDYPYIHLDIAGPSFNKMPFNYRGKGGSGIGVRLLYNFFLNRSM